MPLHTASDPCATPTPVQRRHRAKAQSRFNAVIPQETRAAAPESPTLQQRRTSQTHNRERPAQIANPNEAAGARCRRSEAVGEEEAREPRSAPHLARKDARHLEAETSRAYPVILEAARGRHLSHTPAQSLAGSRSCSPPKKSRHNFRRPHGSQWAPSAKSSAETEETSAEHFSERSLFELPRFIPKLPSSCKDTLGEWGAREVTPSCTVVGLEVGLPTLSGFTQTQSSATFSYMGSVQSSPQDSSDLLTPSRSETWSSKPMYKSPSKSSSRSPARQSIESPSPTLEPLDSGSLLPDEARDQNSVCKSIREGNRKLKGLKGPSFTERSYLTPLKADYSFKYRMTSHSDRSNRISSDTKHFLEKIIQQHIIRADPHAPVQNTAMWKRLQRAKHSNLKAPTQLQDGSVDQT